MQPAHDRQTAGGGEPRVDERQRQKISTVHFAGMRELDPNGDQRGRGPNGQEGHARIPKRAERTSEPDRASTKNGTPTVRTNSIKYLRPSELVWTFCLLVASQPEGHPVFRESGFAGSAVATEGCGAEFG